MTGQSILSLVGTPAWTLSIDTSAFDGTIADRIIDTSVQVLGHIQDADVTHASEVAPDFTTDTMMWARNGTQCERELIGTLLVSLDTANVAHRLAPILQIAQAFGHAALNLIWCDTQPTSARIAGPQTRDPSPSAVTANAIPQQALSAFDDALKAYPNMTLTVDDGFAALDQLINMPSQFQTVIFMGPARALMAETVSNCLAHDHARPMIALDRADTCLSFKGRFSGQTASLPDLAAGLVLALLKDGHYGAADTVWTAHRALEDKRIFVGQSEKGGVFATNVDLATYMSLLEDCFSESPRPTPRSGKALLSRPTIASAPRSEAPQKPTLRLV